MTENKFYCKAPWTALFLHPSGGVKCCCSGYADWGNIKEENIEDILNKPIVKQLRQDIIGGVENQYCHSCREQERLSSTSQRSYFDKFTIPDYKLQDPNLFELYSLDIRWNNLCNLSCVYCNEQWSTTWEKIKGIPINPAKRPYHENILNYIKENGKNVESIIVAGGEPMMHKQNVQLLESLNEDVDIGFITNLTIDLKNNQVYNILKTRKNVTWSISLEGSGDAFEFIRRGAKWDKMRENLDILKSNLAGNQSLFFFSVWCLLSTNRLVEFYKLAEEYQAKVHWQQLIGPEELNLFKFSDPVRKFAYDKVCELLEHPLTKNVSYGLNFLQHGKDEILNDLTHDPIDLKFRSFIKSYEQHSNLKFADIWPELDAIIQNG